VENSRGVEAEREAFLFQLRFGRAIGLDERELAYLENLIADPGQLEAYYDSPI